MPAVALILAICLAAIQAVVVQVQLADAAAIGARSLARGDGLALAESLTRSAVPSSSFAEERMGDIVCVRVGAQPGTMLLMGIQLSVRSCALGAPP
jgi:hypothetical protein